MASLARVPTGWKVRWRTQTHGSRSRTFSRKPDAERFKTQVEHDLGTGRYVDPASGRVGFEAQAWRWFSTTVSLRESTRERDRGYLERYVLPTFAPYQVANIDYDVVCEWVASLSARGLAPATVVKAFQILGKVMTSAVRAHRIAVSPLDGVALPKIERTEMRFLSSSELATLAQAMDPRFSAAVLLAGYSALRAGELFGLRADRVDLLHRRVQVAEIVTEVGGSLVFGPPKTTAGRRRVPIPPLVAEALDAQLAQDGPKDRWVFPAPEGGPVRLGLWRQRFWLPAVRRAGLEPLRIHDLRHTGITLWLAAGADPVTVARWAGHRSTVTVLDRYGHVSADRQDVVVNALEAMARAATPGPDAPVRRLQA